MNNSPRWILDLGYAYGEVHEQLDSTSDRARQLADSGSWELPAAIIARQQTAGRGQPGRTWQATDESLTFTCCFKTASDRPTELSLIPLIPLIVGDAVTQIFDEQLGRPRCQLKWPNDVLIDGYKIAGILVESLADSTGRRVISIGIGVNINQSTDHLKSINRLIAPDAMPAGSLAQFCQHRLDQELLLRQLLNVVRARVEQWMKSSATNVEEFTARFSEKLFGLNQKISLTLPNSTIRVGRLLGISPTGGILMQVGDQQETFFSGTMRLAESS